MSPAEDRLGDIDSAELREVMHRAADLVADYLEGVEDYPVLPPVRPGDVGSRLPEEPPLSAEGWDAILSDYKSLIEPNVTHWNHPGFAAYFSITGSGPGIVGETLCAALNVNAMLWRTSPAATELEERVCSWLRQLMGLPEAFCGHINDTASVSTLLALAAARHRACPEVSERGMSQGPRLRVYASDQAHSSVEKAALTLGLGLDNVVKVATDERYRMDPVALERAIEADLGNGETPIAVVATAGTTSTTSVDPLSAVGPIAREHDLWFHVDAAYGGSAAICSELRGLFDGWEDADSIVVNPHKWLFVPTDCSVLFLRNPDALRAAFSVVPAYLASDEDATNLMDYGFQLGRRFRALKLWMVLRRFGARGLQLRILAHCSLASTFERWIESAEEWELLAPVPFSVVCFAFRPRSVPEAELDSLNQRLLQRVNREGSQLLSSTELRGRVTLRVAIGNLRTELRHVERIWEALRREARSLMKSAAGAEATEVAGATEVTGATE